MEYIPTAAEFKHLQPSICKPFTFGNPSCSFFEPIKSSYIPTTFGKPFDNSYESVKPCPPTFGIPASNSYESVKPCPPTFGIPASNSSESVKPGPPIFGKPPGRAGFNSPIPTFHSTTSWNSGLQLIVDEIDKLELEFVKKVAWLNLAMVLRTSLSTELILVKWRDLFRPVDYSFRKEEYIKPVVFDILKAKGYTIQEGFDDGFLLSV